MRYFYNRINNYTMQCVQLDRIVHISKRIMKVCRFDDRIKIPLLNDDFAALTQGTVTGFFLYYYYNRFGFYYISLWVFVHKRPRS